MNVWKRLPIGLLLVPIILKAQTLPTVPIYAYSVPSGGYAANSNLMNYTDSVMGTWSMQYDNLNRLGNASSNAGYYSGLNMQWGYDSFGNRRSQSVSGTSNASVPTPQTQTYGPNNQLWTDAAAPVRTVDLSGNVLSGIKHDAAGNMTYDGVNSMAYDAESRVCAVLNGTTGSITQYLYNGDGQRVAKGYSASGAGLVCPIPGDFVATEKYILGLAGEQVTQTDGSDKWQHTNVYAAGQLLATYDEESTQTAGGQQSTQQPLHFNISDPLGTKRIQASAVGGVELTCLSLPFGDGLTCNGAGQDATEHHFTGKERDTESGLDYFGARYYGSAMGRFMSPDWASKPQAVPYSDLTNPQSLNLYSYVNNNPLSQVDADGHFASPWHFLLSFVAAIVTGHDPIYAAKLGYQNVMVDIRTQGPTPDQTGIHGTGAVGQSFSEAYEDTVQALQKEQANGDTAGVQHTVQDPWAPGHDYSDWPGSFSALGPWGTIKHELGDWFPSPWALGGALVRSIRALQNPNAAPDTLLRPQPGGGGQPSSTSPTPQSNPGGMPNCIGCVAPPRYFPPPPPQPMPDPSQANRVAQ